jgi:hypothetical protein
MKIYSFSVTLESAVIALLEDTSVILATPLDDSPAYVKALRHLKATSPSIFQMRSTGAPADHPGDKMMWEILSASERRAIGDRESGVVRYEGYCRADR